LKGLDPGVFSGKERPTGLYDKQEINVIDANRRANFSVTINQQLKTNRECRVRRWNRWSGIHQRKKRRPRRKFRRMNCPTGMKIVNAFSVNTNITAYAFISLVK
jgi:hypothetical protein